MNLKNVPGKKGNNIQLYALSTCPWCKKTKALLDTLGVEYYFIDVDLLTGDDREEAMAVVKKWNPGASFPVTVINEARCIVGFREADLKAALNL